MSDLYRLVYSSRNLLDASEREIEAEIAQILQASQANNEKVGVTGALMFNAGAFAQVLEGPRVGVEATFERIQRDTRHADVTVLQCGPAESRGFANWSMAFVGNSALGKAMWNDLAFQTGFDISRIGGDQVFGMLRDLVLEDEGVAFAPTLEPEHKPASTVAPTLDAAAVRAELERVRPDRAPRTAVISDDAPPALRSALNPTAESLSGAGTSPVVQGRSTPASTASLTVMRDSLAEERQRTTELRGQIDDLKIALADAATELAALKNDRDRWAQRAYFLASAIADEAAVAAEPAASDREARKAA